MTVTSPDPQAILALPMNPNAAEAATVRDYLVALLARLWSQEADFDPRRPFGLAYWHEDLYEALVDGGAIAGTPNGDPDNSGEAYDLIAAAIAALGAPVPAQTAPTTREDAVEAYLDEALAVDPTTVDHPSHDYATDGWRWSCPVCNPLPSDILDPDFADPDYPDYDEPLSPARKDTAA